MIESISALTLATHDMTRATAFYEALGFELVGQYDKGRFTTFRVGSGYLNLVAAPSDKQWAWWGRAIFYVSDVDAFYANAVAQGFKPEAPPRDAEWHERYFHITDPDGHELSFARPLRGE